MVFVHILYRLIIMRVAIVTTMWKRPEIFSVFATQCKYLKDKYGNLELIVTGSEAHVSREQAERYGFTYIEHANKPLGRKQNQSAIRSKDFDVDYIICLGSDDLITESLYERYLEYFSKGFDFIAPLDCYFIDSVSKRSLYWAGYRGAWLGMTCGAGRALSKKLLKKLGWQPWFDDQYSDVLDTGMDKKLETIQHTRFTFYLGKDYLIDIKSPVNMTTFERWDNSGFYDTNELLKSIPHNVRQLLTNISR